MVGERSRTTPVVPGCCSSAPNTADGSSVGEVADDDLDADRLGAGGDHGDRLRVASRRRRRTADAACLVERRISVIASAAAVDSSSIDALAMSMPVRSVTIVWKLRSASSRPWLISGWYGV